jgi:hypothetical protein
MVDEHDIALLRKGVVNSLAVLPESTMACDSVVVRARDLKRQKLYGLLARLDMLLIANSKT